MSRSNIPKTTQRGLFVMSTGNDNEVALVPGSPVAGGATIAVPITWVHPPKFGAGPYSNFGPTPIFMPVDPTTNVQLIGGMFWALETLSSGIGILGTEYKLNIDKNGSAIAGMTNIYVTYSTSPVFASIAPIDTANDDQFDIELIDMNAPGTNLYGATVSCTLFFAVTALT